MIKFLSAMLFALLLPAGVFAQSVSSITPSAVNLASPPASFTISGSGFADLGFGLPVVNFVRNGLTIAQARATATDGTNLTVPYPTNATSIGGARPGLSVGAVNVEVLNQTAASSFTLVGSVALTITDTAKTQTVTIQLSIAADHITNEDGFQVYQCLGVGCVPTTKIGSPLPPDATSYTDVIKNDPGKRTIGYAVAAFNKAGEGPKSATAYAITPEILLAPAGQPGINAIVVGVTVP